jgi:lipoyl-dependent peroxiredoxin
MKRKASAVWEGNLKAGKGRVSTPSGAVNAQYSFSSRFEEGAGTNPEELVGAAHAGCFAMFLGALLGEANLNPQRIEATATVSLEKNDAGWTVTSSHLDVVASVPGIDPAVFQEHANRAKEGCPISRLLRAEISMTARLE